MTATPLVDWPIAPGRDPRSRRPRSGSTPSRSGHPSRRSSPARPGGCISSGSPSSPPCGIPIGPAPRGGWRRPDARELVVRGRPAGRVPRTARRGGRDPRRRAVVGRIVERRERGRSVPEVLARRHRVRLHRRRRGHDDRAADHAPDRVRGRVAPAPGGGHGSIVARGFTSARWSSPPPRSRERCTLVAWLAPGTTLRGMDRLTVTRRVVTAAAIVLVALVALSARLLAVERLADRLRRGRLPAGRPALSRPASRRATRASSPDDNYRTEHPPLAKIVTGIALAPLPPAPEIPTARPPPARRTTSPSHS